MSGLVKIDPAGGDLGRRSMLAAPRGGRGPHGRHFLGRRLPLKGERETLVVVPRLPLLQRGSGRLEVHKPLPAPKLLVIDPVAALHFPFCCGRGGRMYRCRSPAASTASANSSGNSRP